MFLTMEVTEYLTKELGYKYVLTSKLNQDCLEKYFGILRGAGGCEDHPTVSTFLQLHRLLSFYTPCKKLLTGNIRDDGKVTVLASFKDSLISKAKTLKRKKMEWKVQAEEILFEKLKNLEASEGDVRNTIHSKIFHKFGDATSVPMNIRALIYHLVGYLVQKAPQLLECQECCKSLERPANDFGFVPQDGKLTELLDEGSNLRYPSIEFFNLFAFEVEPVVSEMLGTGDFYGDILTRVLQSLGTLNHIRFGCNDPNHFESIMFKMVPYYITLRFQFYTRSVMRDGHGILTKNRRKESKLISK